MPGIKARAINFVDVERVGKSEPLLGLFTSRKMMFPCSVSDCWLVLAPVDRLLPSFITYSSLKLMIPTFNECLPRANICWTGLPFFETCEMCVDRSQEED